MRHLQLILGLIPGLGQVHKGFALKGTVLFFLFAFFANGVLMAPFWFPDPMYKNIRLAALIGTCALWVYSFVDLVLLHLEKDQPESMGSFSSENEENDTETTETEQEIIQKETESP